MYNMADDDSSGPAADTGSAVHKACEAWHGQGLTVKDAIKSMKDNLPLYPQADLADAETNFLAYALDPRNQKAKIIAVEKEIRFTLDPADHDPTGHKIHVKGTLDQIREENGVLKLYDVKTSKFPGMAVWAQHAYQIAGYCVGATQSFGRDVHPGGIILTRGYLRKGIDPRSSPPDVFFKYPYDLARARVLLSGVADMVALVRSGYVFANPGQYCSWCPMRGHDYCVDKLYELTVLGKPL
jgi:hypothetical protein